MTIPFAGSPLDRAAALRNDDAAIAALKQDPRAQVLLIPAGELSHGIPYKDLDAPNLHWHALADAFAAGLPHDQAYFLGLKSGAPCFVASLPKTLEGDAETDPTAPIRGDLRSLSLMLPPSQTAKAGLAQILLRWHIKEPRCPGCGGPTEAREGGWRRQCLDEACGLARYPRTDPAVLMLLTRGDFVALGRQPQFPEGVYSCLAGYLEPGETLEECVIREAHEEVGLQVASPQYRRSQPWPLSEALMIGFQAEAQNEDLTIDYQELEDARWFSRREVRDILLGTAEDSPYRAPFKTALATILMQDWVAS